MATGRSSPSIGQSAWLFRTGAVRTSVAPLDVPVSAEQRNQSAQSGQSIASWVVNRAGLPRETPLTRRVRLARDAAVPVVSPVPADTGELTFNQDAKLLLLNARSAAGVFGSAGKGTATAGPLDVQLAASSRGFASVLLTARDGRPIASSRRLLLSIPGYSLRSLPSTAQPQALKNYPGTTDWWTIASSNGRPSGDLNGGMPPTWMERVEAYVTLRTHATSIVVSVLDGAGEPAGELPESEIERVTGGFRIHLNAASPWYAITAIQPSPPKRRKQP